jgi:hypothetical protein
MRDNHNPHKPWNKGKTKEDTPQLSNSGAKKGHTPWSKGVPTRLNPNTKKIVNMETGEVFFGLAEVKIKYSNAAAIVKCCKGANVTPYKCHWKYIS